MPVDFDNANVSDVQDNLPVGSLAHRVAPMMTDEQFKIFMATVNPPVPLVAPAMNRPAHAMSDSGPEELNNDINLDDYGDDAEACDELMAQPDAPSDPVGDVMALMAPDVSAQSSGDEQLLSELGLAWAQCYAKDESVGPEISGGLAELVAQYMRNRPLDEHIREIMSKIAVPKNCPRMVVPQLNSGVNLAMKLPNSKLTERVLARITAIVCKAMVPVLNVIDDVITNKPDCKLPPGRREALSQSLILLSSVINVANQGRKSNIQASIDNPLLRQICGPETPVGDKELFDFNLLEKMAELKKAKNMGLTTRPRGRGSWRGRGRSQSRPYYVARGRGYPNRPSGQYYAGRGGRGSQSFFPDSQRGKGRGQ